MAQHSHSHPLSLHCRRVVHTGLPVLAGKRLVRLEEYMGSAEVRSRSQGASAGLAVLVALLAVQTV